MSKPYPILVLAGSYSEYCDYIKEQGATNPLDTRWVSGINQNRLRGQRFSTIVTCGTFWSSADAQERFHRALASVWTELETTKMQQGEIRKLPKSNSPMFVEQWSYRGSAKAPYIVSWKPVNHPTQTGVREWQCSCKSWTTTVPRVACKHIIAIQLKEKILVMAPPTKHPLILIKPVGDHVVISKDEHEEYKKFLAARGTRKAGNQFDEEGRKFRV